MPDLSLDLSSLSSPNYKDLSVYNDDLILTSDSNPAGTNPILQSILQRLAFYQGEWFLDNSLGVPWYQQILVKNPNKATVDAILVNTILGTPGVIQLNKYSSTANRPSRILTVSFDALTTSGPISFNGGLLLTQDGFFLTTQQGAGIIL